MSAQQVPVQLSAGYYDPTGPMGEQPRGPIAPPTVYLEDYSLSFVADHPEYVLYIKDENEDVVYFSVVTSTETINNHDYLVVERNGYKFISSESLCSKFSLFI